MATALVHLTTAMQHLGILQAAATPSNDQQNTGLLVLNNMLQSWTAEGLLGFTVTEAVSGKSTSVGIAGAVVTTTEVGGTKTTVLTKTQVSTYGSIGANNTYPDGWDAAIQYNLAVSLIGPFGVSQVPAMVLERAQSTKAAISPPVPGAPAA